ncbi:hypothetical protein AB0M10_15630 [Streptomyces sp. NPDC051840]|uniref:hypothetical protein n=1 Tax=Streptomyces sp. NPDC051840 TaxID=3154752 RepID=UPI003428E463
MPDIKAESPAILRGMLRDIVACSDYDEVCQTLGLIPASPEVEKAEHHQSHVRVRRYLPAAGATLGHADVAADLLYQLTQPDQDGREDERRAMFRFVCRTACTAVIAQLLHKNILEIGDAA